MDHSENDKRFYVYIHKDLDGNIRYVGSGTRNRFNSKTARKQEHLDMWDSLTKEIIVDGVSRYESAKIEEKLILENWESGLLLNKRKSSTIPKQLSYDHISKYLEYDESSPSYLRCKNTQRGNKKKGDCAGYLSKSGYWVVCVDYKTYKAHRVVWVLCNKQDLNSNMFIDHIDRNKSNNNITNLRCVTAQVNCLNKDSVENAEYASISWSEKRSMFAFRVLTEDGRGFTDKFISPHVLFPEASANDAKSKTLKILEDMKEIIKERRKELGVKYLSSDWIKNNVFSLVRRNRPFGYNFIN